VAALYNRTEHSRGLFICFMMENKQRLGAYRTQISKISQPYRVSVLISQDNKTVDTSFEFGFGNLELEKESYSQVSQPGMTAKNILR